MFWVPFRWKEQIAGMYRGGVARSRMIPTYPQVNPRVALCQTLNFLEPRVRGLGQHAARFPRSRCTGVRVAHQRKALDRTLRLVHLELDPAACRSRLKGLEGAPVLAVSVREERREREVEDVAREVLQAHVGGPDGGVDAVETRRNRGGVVEPGEVGDDGLTVRRLALGGAEGDREIKLNEKINNKN